VVRYAGAAAMYMVSKKLKKKYNITDERAALYDAADTWTEALNGRDFLGTFMSYYYFSYCFLGVLCRYCSIVELCLKS
jgi:hypothetical protein